MHFSATVFKHVQKKNIVRGDYMYEKTTHVICSINLHFAAQNQFN